MILAGKIALVTGAASGIGAASATALADAGAHVVLVDRAPPTAVCESIRTRGGTATDYTLDLAETHLIPNIVTSVIADFGKIDILVNAAGIAGDQGSILDATEADWDAVHSVNLKAPFLLMQLVARHMVAAGDGGRIVNVGSSSAYRASRVGAAYGSAKAALSQLTRSAAADLGPYDINVNAVAPGVTATAMTANLGEESALDDLVKDGPLANLLGRASRPEDVAGVIVFLCLPASRQITGQTIHTSAGAIV